MNKITKEVLLKVMTWQYTSENTGLSSECMAAVLCGIETKSKTAPCDPSDFNRCLQLLKFAPELKSRLHLMKQVSKQWKALVENWDEIEKCFISEVGENWKEKGKSATATYYAMKGLGL
jgi:hypothetical protein